MRPVSVFPAQLISAAMVCLLPSEGLAQAFHGDVEPPPEWEHLARGGRFRDLILPAPIIDGLEKEAWGADGVLPRDVDNSIEDPEWSYWGGRPIQGPEGIYHMFVARWPEGNPRGHSGWLKSEIVRAVSESPLGPFEVAEVLGVGHFPEIHLKPDGKYWCYHLHGAYVSESLEGPWNQISKKEIGLGYMFGSMAIREDGSELVIDRFCRMWLKEIGDSKFTMVRRKNIWPRRIHAAMGYEDPMIWRTEVQYHLLVNDWHGRVCYHMRSKDGIHWKEDPGEAYGIDVDRYEDGTSVDWYKLERPKVLQDRYGRATHLYLAALDVPKKNDKTNDGHGSKNIALPLVVERRLSVLNEESLERAKEIRLLIRAEEGFDPQTEVEVSSLRFGAPEVVDFGRGCKATGSQAQGEDLVVIFDGFGHGFDDDNFAGKLLGSSKDGALLYGYSRLPGVDYSPYVITAGDPETQNAK
jgi:hypothetical protein